MQCCDKPYHGDHTTGADAIVEAIHTLVVRVLSPPHEELVSHVVGAIVGHEATALHPARVALAQVGGHVRAVAAALIGAALEVLVLVEDDLEYTIKVLPCFKYKNKDDKDRKKQNNVMLCPL